MSQSIKLKEEKQIISFPDQFKESRNILIKLAEQQDESQASWKVERHQFECKQLSAKLRVAKCNRLNNHCNTAITRSGDSGHQTTTHCCSSAAASAAVDHLIFDIQRCWYLVKWSRSQSENGKI